MDQHRVSKLKALGMTLFFFGLLLGIANPYFKNPRMGVSAHLEGVLNGIFLIVVALIWQDIKLGAKAKTLFFWLLTYGTIANVVMTTYAAAFGTSKLTPIAGAGYSSEPLHELVMSVGLYSLATAMLIAAALGAKGLLTKRR